MWKGERSLKSPSVRMQCPHTPPKYPLSQKQGALRNVLGCPPVNLVGSWVRQSAWCAFIQLSLLIGEAKNIVGHTKIKPSKHQNQNPYCFRQHSPYFHISAISAFACIPIHPQYCIGLSMPRVIDLNYGRFVWFIIIFIVAADLFIGTEKGVIGGVGRVSLWGCADPNSGYGAVFHQIILLAIMKQAESTQNLFDETPLIRPHKQPQNYNTGYLPRSSLPERKAPLNRNRYNRPQKTLNSIKELLVISPDEGIFKSMEESYSRIASPCRQLYEKMVGRHKHNSSNKQMPHLHIEEKRGSNRETMRVRKVYNRMSTKIEDKAKVIGSLSKKLRPIADNLNKNRVEPSKMPPLEIKVGQARQVQAGVEHIKNNTRVSFAKNKLMDLQQMKVNRTNEEKEICNAFSIQSIQPSAAYLNEKRNSSNFKNERKYTKYQLHTYSEIKQERQIEKKANMTLLTLSMQLQAQKTELNPESQTNLKSEQTEVQSKQQHPRPSKTIKKSRKFIIPFETFFYRDFLWRVNLTNEVFVEPPLQYEHRLKVYVGKGNNSCMVRGLINRRYWFAYTDRIQEANFVWTQLKDHQYFKIQKPTQTIPKKHQPNTQYLPKSALNLNDAKKIKGYWQNHMKTEQHGDERLLLRLKHFRYSQVVRPEQLRNGRMHNHFRNNYIIGNKKALLNTMRNYYLHAKRDPFQYLPLSFHIVKGMEDAAFLQFQRYYHRRNKQIKRVGQDKLNLWIVKPGECTNRGQGIKVCQTLKEIKQIVKLREWWADGSEKTYIIQAYIEKPLLYKKRKFDLRHYILMTCVNGCIKGYWYADGYVRTSSAEYKLNNSNHSIHLTNDAIQKYLPDYGKYEKGNKLSYDQLEAYIQKSEKGRSFYKEVYPQMKAIATDIFRASARYVDPGRLENNFEVFGLDFMIDADLKVWLIEVNSNPCLELSCPLLSQIIPNMVQNTLQYLMTLDVMYPPPVRYTPKMPRYLTSLENANKFQLVFDERIEDGFGGNDDALNSKLLIEEDQVFQDDGSQWEDN